MRVLITGSTGFVGKNLSLYLKNRDIDSSVLNRDGLVNESLHIENITTVVHLAGKAHDVKKVSDPKEYYEVNYELTKKLYDSFLKSTASKFIFISSVKAAADSVEGVLTEIHVPNPQTHYGKSKLMAEQYILSQPLPKGKAYYILRPCMIHGPGNKGNLNLFYQFVKKGIPYPLSAFNNKRSYLSIENLCFVITELVFGNAPSGVYHVADDEPLSTTKVFSLLAQSTHKIARLWPVPKKLVKFIASIGDKIKLPLNSESLGKLTDNYVVSNEKIKNALNKSLPVTATEGLLKTAQSFNENHHI